MPIMAVDERNDARGAAFLLASTARDCIDNPAIAPDSEVALNNVYRLLEAYRTDAFFGLGRSSSQSPRGVSENLTLMPPIERHAGEIRIALKSAIAEAFEEQPEDNAIETIEGVLRNIAYPQDYSEPSPGARATTSKFFENLLQNLDC